jgi:23S rRNA (adenine2030-N6)-methyltransferase
VESQPAIARALQRNLDAARAQIAAPCRVVSGDGYQQLRALLPPPQRRGLILIDPPYEDPDEERRIGTALQEALVRFQTGVYALWYPIKKRRDTDLWLARVTRGIDRPHLVAELCLHPADNAAGLNGSGLLVVNPPWHFDEHASQWQPQLLSLLGGTGGSAVRWLAA